MHILYILYIYTIYICGNDPFQDIVDQKGLLFFCNKISVYFSTIIPLPNIGGTGVAPNHPFIDGLFHGF